MSYNFRKNLTHISVSNSNSNLVWTLLRVFQLREKFIY